MTALHRIKSALKRAILRSGYRRTRNVLLGLSDRQLADAGISRELLLQGIDAWPWRDPAETAGSAGSPAHAAPRVRAAAPSARRIRNAERELYAYSDRELADLGISRDNVAYVVRNGRPGVDARA